MVARNRDLIHDRRIHQCASRSGDHYDFDQSDTWREGVVEHIAESLTENLTESLTETSRQSAQQKNHLLTQAEDGFCVTRLARQRLLCHTRELLSRPA